MIAEDLQLICCSFTVVIMAWGAMATLRSVRNGHAWLMRKAEGGSACADRADRAASVARRRCRERPYADGRTGL
jgi:hypothetical protein